MKQTMTSDTKTSTKYKRHLYSLHQIYKTTDDVSRTTNADQCNSIYGHERNKCQQKTYSTDYDFK